MKRKTAAAKCDRCGADEPAPVRVVVLDKRGKFVRADYCCPPCVMVDAQKSAAAASER